MIIKCILLLMYYTVLAFVYNIEEAEHLKYGIDINSNPVLRSEVSDVEHIIMKSKYNQEYSCVLPNIATKDETDTELENVLKSFSARFAGTSCLYRTKGWWTYRVCYGEIIQQYRQEDVRLRSQVPEEFTVIGHYEKDMNWTELLESKNIKYYEQLPQTHKQYFTEGDICDETGLPRQATVSYACDPDASRDFIALIDEREICVYKIVINTPRMCKHEMFMPGHAGVKHKISCSPIVNSLPSRHHVMKRPSIHVPKMTDNQPNWVGAFPTTQHYTLRDYLDDLAHSRYQNPIRAIRKMIEEVIGNLNINDLSLTDKTTGKEVDLEHISESQIQKILESDEIENVMQQLVHSAKREVEVLQKKQQIEIKVIYRDADGNVKISDADGRVPELHDTVLQLMAAGVEEQEEMERHSNMQDAYKYVEHTPQGEDGDGTS